MKYLLICLTFSLLLFSSCEENVENSDLTTQIIGNYKGTVTLKIGSSEALDVDDQEFLVEKIDDSKIRLIPVIYPDVSPVDTLNFSVDLTATPLGFINTEGVMLTIASETYADGTVSGTPYSLNNVQQDAHGRYANDLQELVFAIEIVKNGVSEFEFFVGKKQ